MKYLVDTNAWINFFAGERSFGRHARTTMEYEAWNCCVSLASVWEAAIKAGLGKLSLPYSLGNDLQRLFADNGFTILPLDWRAMTAVQHLEPVHGDPFDRIQVVQARQHGLDIISRDPVFDRYGLRRVW